MVTVVVLTFMIGERDVPVHICLRGFDYEALGTTMKFAVVDFIFLKRKPNPRTPVLGGGTVTK
jgi:hypothetical protein